MQKILITGAGGMLGAAIARLMKNEKQFKVYETGKKNIQLSGLYFEADLLNIKEIDSLLAATQPDIIIHCAAIVNLNYCEQNKEEAYMLHFNATKKLASYNAGKCKFIYISTDSVFDGEKGNYSETDAPKSLNYYALSKLEGEKAALSANPFSLAIRTNIYGFNSNKDGNSLFEWIHRNLSDKKRISGFTDVFFNPLYIGQLAELINLILNKNLTGIINAGCIEKISKYEFALLIAEAFGFDKSLIKAGNSTDMHSVLQRPKNTTLNINKLTNAVEKTFSIEKGINQLKTDFIQ